MQLHLLPFVICLLAGVLLFAGGWLATARGQRAALAAAITAFALLLAKMVLAWEPVWEAALFPWPAYIFLQGFAIFLIGLLFFGIAMPQLKVAWNRVLVGLLAAGVLAYAAYANLWMVAPEVHGEERGADAAHHYHQTTFHTCAPSSCVSALSYVGVAATEREMSALCLTHDDGTTVFNTYRGLTLKLLGTPWRCRVVRRSAAELLTTGTTAVITELPGFHAIATCGLGGAVEVQDPLLQKPVRWTLAQLVEHYDGPVAVVIEPVTGAP
jgi:hypothetical protein